ncbi:hypothetical protein [Mycobacterium sp. D16Q16]|uniref:hypothetical protein n=1 Tax=Mycobacterium sp. D16Q16 TaxID=1855659 RepID=UPI00099340D2|nr:hypothetical protein [Mycobacterium sp. D16Q16]
MADTASPSSVLRGLASGIPEPQQRWSRGEGLGGKPTPKAEPKPTTTPAAAPADSPKPAVDTKPAPDTKPADTKPSADMKASDTKRFSPAVGKTMTNLGVPPSAVRNIKSGERVAGIKGLAKGQWNAGQHWAGRGAEKVGKLVPSKFGKGALKTAAKFVPGLGAAVAGYAAIHNFKQGDYVGAALNAIGMIPGPVGWVALGASAIWEMSGFGDRYEEWAKPDGTNTYMLQADAKDVSNVREVDAALRTAQQNVFSFQDGPTGSVWDASPPPALELSNAEVKAAAEAWLTGISDHFAAIDKALTGSGEQYFTEQRASLAAHFTAMAALKTQVKQLTDQLSAADQGGALAYRAVTTANAAARGQLASSGSLNDHGPATTMETEVQKGQSGIAAANSKLERLWAETPPAVVLVRDLTAGGTKPEKKTEPVKPVTATPAAVTPAAQTPAAATPAKTETPTKNNDDLSKLLSQLGQQKAATPTSNPLGSGGGLGGGSPLGAGTGGGTGGGTPLATSKPDSSEKSEPKKLADDKKTEDKKAEPRKLGDDKSLSGAKPEQARAVVPGQGQKPVAPVPAAAVTAPGAAAPTPAQANAAHAAQAAEPNKEVDVKGQKTVFPDAKTAKLAEILSKADPTHPVSLADAAKQAGLTPPVAGQDPGTQVNPAQAKPGDIMVAADKSYMLLGDGKFYDLTDYKIVGASDLPQNLGDRAGYFHLNDPNPGQAAPGQPGDQAPAGAPAQQPGPVSGQTGGVQNPVPNATGALQGPADASQPAAGAPAGTGGVPSTGAPGVPKPGGAGPANAASTETGTGQGGPSSGGGALDPGAVR